MHQFPLENPYVKFTIQSFKIMITVFGDAFSDVIISVAYVEE